MDGIIDILIAVLFIAIPAIFKAVGNRLEKSGSDKAGKFKKVAEAFEDQEDESTLEGWILEKMEESESASEQVEPVMPGPVFSEPVFSVPVIPDPAPVPVEAPRATRKKTAILIEDEPKKKGEKIDPKKLVIYSEIMKPKF